MSSLVSILQLLSKELGRLSRRKVSSSEESLSERFRQHGAFYKKKPL